MNPESPKENLSMVLVLATERPIVYASRFGFLFFKQTK